MNVKRPVIVKDMVKTEYESKYIHVYDLQYEEGKHYLDASRRDVDRLVATLPDEEYKRMIPDAVSCVVIVEAEDEEPRLLLSWEYRYPTGHMVLGVPAGLIDAEDFNKSAKDAIVCTAIREIYEETGIHAKPENISVVNPLLFSTPGMTDENNAIVRVRITTSDLKDYSRNNSESSEYFEGLELLTRNQVKKLLDDGRDSEGNYYSVYTWIALAQFMLDTM